MNTLLYIGLAVMLFGFIAFLISAYMESYYDRKLWKLRNRFEYIKVKPKIKNGNIKFE